MKKILILSLAIIMIVSVFLPVCAYAEDYDADFEFTWQGGSFKYSLSDNASELSQAQINRRAVFRSMKIKKAMAEKMLSVGYGYRQVLCYLFPNFNSVLKKMEKTVEIIPKNASFKISKGKVTYAAHRNGRKIDYAALFNAVFDGKTKMEIPVSVITPDFTLMQAKAATTLRGKFYTTFYSSGSNRCHNIAKAMSAFEGLKIETGEKVSFNKITGERTVENGYRESKIILNGEYVDGVGGGVCQVSTTLYNALLLSGLDVINRSKHSLVSNYIMSGFDAMVNSGSADLIFENNTGSDVYISATSDEKKAVFYIFGVANPFEIKRESAEIKREPPETKIIIDKDKKYADRVLYDDETFVLTYGSDYVEAEAYLVFYSGNKEVKRKFLHKDIYSAAPKVIVKGAEKRPVLMPDD